MSLKKHLIFVYGTLMRGEPNYYVGQQIDKGHLQFVSQAITVKCWPLVVAPHYYNTPFLLYKENTGKSVYGEVYSVDDAMLAEYDKLENHPAYYERDLIEVQSLGDDGKPTGELQCVYVYFLKQFQPDLLDLNHHEKYSAKTFTGYVLPKDRDPEEAKKGRKLVHTNISV